MIKEAECWSLEHTGVGLSETELELVKYLEEKFTSTNKQSAAIAQIAADIGEWADHPGNNAVRVNPSVFRKWARQLRSLS